MAKAEDTKCYTYKVEMIVQIVARDEARAKMTLDQVGGHITHRDTKLLDCISLWNKEEENKKS